MLFLVAQVLTFQGSEQFIHLLSFSVLLKISMGDFDESKSKLSIMECKQILELYCFYMKEIRLLSDLVQKDGLEVGSFQYEPL
jgi:hypothetical protein